MLPEPYPGHPPAHNPEKGSVCNIAQYPLAPPTRLLYSLSIPRSVRIEYAGARYRAMNRGSRGEAICRDDYDRRRFLGTLGEAVARTSWLVHACVLVSNHYHLML